MPAKKRRVSAQSLDMSVFGNPKTRTRQAVAQLPSKNVRQKLTGAVSRGAAVAGGKTSRGSGRPPGADWYRVEEVRRTPVTDSVVRVPVVDTTIVQHRGAPVPKSTLGYAKAGAAAGGGAVAAAKMISGGAKLAKRVGKRIARKLPLVGPLLTGASVGRTVYKIAKSAKAGEKINKAQAIRALISSAL